MVLNWSLLGNLLNWRKLEARTASPYGRTSWRVGRVAEAFDLACTTSAGGAPSLRVLCARVGVCAAPLLSVAGGPL